MKRKVKFQEGGPVGAEMTAAERRRANIERLNSRRAVEDFNRREQTGQLDERTMRRAGGTPVTSEVADFDRRLRSGQLDADTMRRMGGTPTGPSASAMSRMVPRAGGILGLLGLAPLAVDAYRAARDRPRSQDDMDVREAYRTGRDVSEIRREREAAAARPAATPDQMQTADVPGNRATSGAGSPAAQRMREADMQGADMPGNVAMNPPARPQPTRRAASPARRESVTADDLNAMVLRLQGGSPPQTETERRLADRMGIAYRKGGLVKKYQAGGSVSNMSRLSDAELNRLGYAAQGSGSARGLAKTQLEQRKRMPLDETKESELNLQRAMELQDALDRGENAAVFMNELVRSGGGMKQHKAAEYKKGGLVKPKVGADFRKAKPYQAGGPVKVPGKTPASGGPKPPARMRDRISSEERKELDAPLTQAEKSRLRGDNFKRGGKVLAKKMKSGGKVPAPKKMMKGGMAKAPGKKTKMMKK